MTPKVYEVIKAVEAGYLTIPDIAEYSGRSQASIAGSMKIALKQAYVHKSVSWCKQRNNPLSWFRRSDKASGPQPEKRDRYAQEYDFTQHPVMQAWLYPGLQNKQ